MRRPPPRPQRGLALLTALFLFAAGACSSRDARQSVPHESAPGSGTAGKGPAAATTAPQTSTTPAPSREAPMKLVVSDSQSALLRATHVLVVRFDKVTTGEWARSPAGGVTRSLEVELTLEEVVKGQVQDAPGQPITTTLTQHGTGTSRVAKMPGAWSMVEVTPGSRFVALSVSSAQAVSELVRDPACQRAFPAEDALADAHLAQQVEAGALDVTGASALAKKSAATVGFLFAEYLWARFAPVALADEKKFDPIAELVEDPGLGAAGRGTFIAQLTTALTSPEPPPQKQLDRYAVSLFRVLGTAAAQPFHDNIVGTYLPTVLDLASHGARKPDQVFEDYPGEKAKALAAVSAYHGAEDAAPLAAWLRR